MKRVSRPYAPGGTVYWTEYEFDARGRTTKVTPPGNMGFTSYVYEANTVKVIEPGGTRWKRFTLDALGRLVKVTEPRPGAPGQSDDTLYSYNAVDKLVQVTMTRAGVTQTRTFAYDSQMRLSSVTQPENGMVSYTYNANGQVASRTDARGARAEYSYDAYGRLSMVKRYPSSQGPEDAGQRTTYVYDSYNYGANQWGRLAGIVYGYGFEETFSYTVAGRVAEHRQDWPWQFTHMAVKYGWDTEGRMVWQEYPRARQWDAGSAQWVERAGRRLEYGYDAMGRPVSLSDSFMPGWMAAWVTGAEYNAAGQLLRFNRLNTQQRTYQYNVRGQLVRERETNSGYPMMDFEYRYSATANDGRVVQMKDWVSGEEVNHQYDELGRLIASATTGPQWGLSWTYDGFGNRLAQNVTKGTAPVVSLSISASTNRITTSGFAYDAAGNLVQWPGGTVTMGADYDVDGRLSVVRWDGVERERYYYNARNLRVTGGGSYQVYGLSGELLGEYRPIPNSTVPEMWRERVYFAGRLVATLNNYGWEASNTDRLGSVRAARRYPFGEGNNIDNDEFATYRKDTTAQHYYAWHRYYSATWGRFSSPDPYVMSGGLTQPQGWNRYSYVENDPVNFTDASGLQRDICGDDEMQNDPYCIYKRGGSGRWGIGMGSYWNGEYWSNFWAPIWIPSPPGGGSGARPWDPKSLLPGMRSRAIDGALDILKKNAECARIYNITGKGLGPVDLLQKLAAGDTEYGVIRYGYIENPKVSATTTRLIVEPESTIEAGALITLNDNLGSNWFLGDEKDRVLTILHELGHAFDVIYGAGSSALPANESEEGISRSEQTKRSMQNSAFVREKCFR